MSDAATAARFDRKGLIREAYRIDGIDAPQCRSVFLDWVLGADENPALTAQIAALLALYGADTPDHPMSMVLRDAMLAKPVAKGRRGGWRSRPRD